MQVSKIKQKVLLERRNTCKVNKTKELVTYSPLKTSSQTDIQNDRSTPLQSRQLGLHTKENVILSATFISKKKVKRIMYNVQMQIQPIRANTMILDWGELKQEFIVITDSISCKQSISNYKLMHIYNIIINSHKLSGITITSALTWIVDSEQKRSHHGLKYIFSYELSLSYVFLYTLTGS